MTLQEKINELEADIKRIDDRRDGYYYYNLDAQHSSDISVLEDKLDVVIDFIKELKQLNN